MAQTQPGTALITGASSGIGAIYADRLAQRGYNLILVARSRERLNRLAERITTQTRRTVEVLQADLGDPASLAQVETKLREDASITLLVNNAGIGTHTPLLESGIDAMTGMIALNVTAPTRLAYAAAPGFVARGKGAIINISSIVSIAPELLNGVYGGSKAYVHAFSLSLHHELGGKGVRVQAVLPARRRRTSGRRADCRWSNWIPPSLCRPNRWWTRRWSVWIAASSSPSHRSMRPKRGMPTRPRGRSCCRCCPAIRPRRAISTGVDRSRSSNPDTADPRYVQEIHHER